MDKNIKEIQEYLNQFKQTEDNQIVTHRSFGDYNGNFSLHNLKDRDNLLELYKKNITSLINPNITILEVQPTISFIYVDIDLLINIDNNNEIINQIDNIKHIYNSKMIEEVILIYVNIIEKYNESKLNYSIFVLEKNKCKLLNNSNSIKDGFHMVINIPFDAHIRHLIRHEVNKLLEEKEIFEKVNIIDNDNNNIDSYLEYSNNKIDNINDRSVVSSNGWLLYGSKKKDCNEPYKVSSIYNYNFKKGKLFIDENKYTTEDLINKLSIYKNLSRYNFEPEEENITPKGDNDNNKKNNKNNKNTPKGDNFNSDDDENTGFKESDYNFLNDDLFDEILTHYPDEHFETYQNFINLCSYVKNYNLSYDILDKHLKRASYRKSTTDGKSCYKPLNNKKLYTYHCDFIVGRWYIFKNLKIYDKEYYNKIVSTNLFNKKNKKNNNTDDDPIYKLINILDNELELSIYILNDKNNFMDVKYSNNNIYIYNINNCIWEIYEIEFFIIELQKIINIYKKNYIDLCNKDNIDIDKKIIAKFDKTGKTKNIKEIANIILRNIEYKIYDNNFYLLINSHDNLFPINNNKVIDLKTKEILPRLKEHYFNFYNKLNYTEYNKIINNEHKKIFDKFINNFSLNSENCLYLQKILGYYLSNNNKAQLFFIFCGLGSNGKSTLFNFFQKVLNYNDYNIDNFINVCSDLLIKKSNNNDRATQIKRLEGARVGLLQETNTGEELNAALIKKISGNDSIEIEEKYSTKMTKLNNLTIKLLLSTNMKPIFNGDDDAIIRRVRYFNCNAKFCSNPKHKNERQGILNIDELLLNNCLDIFFSWIVEGAYLYYNSNDKKFENDIPKEILEEQNKYIKSMASIETFFKNCIIKTDTNVFFIKRSDLYISYKKYCDEEIGITAMNKTTFFEKCKIYLGDHNILNGNIGWKNIKLVNNNNNNDLEL